MHPACLRPGMPLRISTEKDVSSIRDKVKKEVVLVNDFLGNELDQELRVLVVFHWRALAEVFDIKDHKFDLWSGDRQCCLLRRHLVVVKLAHCVVVTPGKSSRPPLSHNDMDTVRLVFVGLDG